MVATDKCIVAVCTLIFMKFEVLLFSILYTNEINEWIAEAVQTERQFLSNTSHNSEEDCTDDMISESNHLGVTENL